MPRDDRPIFSWCWLRRRTLIFYAFAAVFAVPTLFGAMTETDDWRAILIATVLIPLPLLTYSVIGPALATWVHARRLERRREAIALVAVIGIGIGAAWAADHGIERGLRVVLYGDSQAKVGLVTSAGVFIHKPGEDIHAASAMQPAADDIRKHLREQFGGMVEVANGALIFLLMLWFGGGFDLLRFFRQRRKFEEAARREALAQALAARNEAELKLSVLAAQVEPHFLFNTLAGVRSAITSDPGRAETMIDHLADYLRASIPRLRGDSTAANSTVASQIAFVRAYLGLMHARMPRFDFTIESPPELSALPMPPLLLIPLVENAVKHGIEPKIGPGRVTVRIARETDDGRDDLIAMVEDDGVGFGGVSSGTGIGLVNIRERLAMLYGDAASLSLSARPDGGVAARLRLPIGET